MACGIYRTFLDTNIVWCADWLRPYIFDGDAEVLRSSTFTAASQRQQAEWLALAEIFRWATHVNPIFIISETVIGELPPVRQPFGTELHTWSTQNDLYSQEVPPNDADRGLLAAMPEHGIVGFLPDSTDRRLMAEAVFHACDSFLTMDQRTIWRHRRLTEQRLGIRVITPRQMFRSVFRKQLVGTEPGEYIWVSRH